VKIEKLKSGLYRTVVYLGKDANGKRIQKSLTDTSRQRLARRASEMVETYRGKAVRLDTFSSALDAYITARSTVLSPSTIAGYRSIERTLAKQDWFTSKPLLDITDADMRRLVSVLNLFPKTLRNITGLVSAVFDFNGLKSPSVRLPAKAPTDRPIPDADTVTAMLQAARGTRLEVPLGLAMMGLRRSEICALSVTDLDRDDILHIHRAAVYGPELVIKDTTKTASSDRYIKIPHQLAQMIRKQGYVTEMTPKALSCTFPHFLRRHGFPQMRLHDCRHFMASYLHSLGVPDAEIMRMGGWKTDHVMKTVYRHALAQEETAQKVADKYADMLG